MTNQVSILSGMIAAHRHRRRVRSGQGPRSEDQLHVRGGASSGQQVREQDARRKVERDDRDAGSVFQDVEVLVA